MSDGPERVNAAIEGASPAMAAALSPLGRRAFFPPDIPFQAAQARGKAFNATIGQITDGHGRALALPAVAAGLAGLSADGRNRALLYSPLDGLPELRRAWARWQRRRLAETPQVVLPIVTVGLTHGLSILADLFGGEGRAVAVPTPFWGNYRQTFATRTGARMVSSPAFDGNAYDPRAVAKALADLPPGEPAVAILNLPSNPGGYSLTAEERPRVREALVEVARERPLVVICDDAYAGLVYEEGVPAGSMFWELVGAHPDLVPVKLDGVTKELSFFGGRVGFLTFALPPGSEAAAALENKVKFLTRATLGSPVAASQAVVLEALGRGSLAEEVEALRRELAGRYRALRGALADCDPALVRPLPFNSGCFALVELPAGLDAEAVRLHLLERHDTGLVSLPPRHLRIAHCSLEEAAVPELVRRLERGVAELLDDR